MLFVKNKDGSLKMCIDYRQLKKFKIKNKYLMLQTYDSWGDKEIERTKNLSLAKNPIIDRIGADPIHWQMKN